MSLRGLRTAQLSLDPIPAGQQRAVGELLSTQMPSYNLVCPPLPYRAESGRESGKLGRIRWGGNISLLLSLRGLLFPVPSPTFFC